MLSIKSFCVNPFGENCLLVWDESGEAMIVDPGCYSKEELSAVEDAVADNNLSVSRILLTHAHFDHIFGVSELSRKYGVPVLMGAGEKAIVENNKYFCNNFGLNTPDNSFADGPWAEFSAAEAGDGESADGKAEAEAGAGESADGKAAAGATSGATEKPAVLTLKDGDKIRWGKGRCWEVLSTPGHTPGGVCYLDREARLLLSGDTLFAGSIGRTDNRWGDYDALIHGIFDKLMPLDGDIDVIPGHGPHTSITDERTKNPFLQPFNEPYEDPDADK